MSTEIYYFSGTGNSLHVAQELHQRLQGSKLIPIVRLVDQERIENHAEMVGFVFPQYASTLPKVVANFIGKLDVQSAAYIFAIATRGGTDCLAFRQLDNFLAEKGRQLDAFFVLNMPSGSQPLVKSYPLEINPERIAALERDMLKRLDGIKQTIETRAEHRDENLAGIVEIPPVLKPIMPLVRALRPLLLQFGKHVESRFGFYYDDRCTGCGICEKVCLANRIKMVDERPVWPNEVQCYGCFACLNFCPEQSVQIRSSWYLKSYTPKNGRYHHPEVTFKDIAAQKANMSRI